MAKASNPLRIPKKLLESPELSDRRKAAWKILLSDPSLFREDGDHHELLTDNLGALVGAECGVEAGGRDLVDVMSGYGKNSPLAEMKVRQYFGEDGEAVDLPHELSPGKTLRSEVLQIAVAHAATSGQDLGELTDAMLNMSRSRMGRMTWQVKKLRDLKDSPLSALTLSTETGMLTVGPARDLDHRETQVLDRENARTPVGFFTGGVWDAPFRKAFCAATAAWLRDAGDRGEEAEKRDLLETAPIRTLVGDAGYRNSRGLEYDLASFLDEAGEGGQDDFFKALVEQGRNHTACPLQFVTGHGGDLHLGQLPTGLLRHLLRVFREQAGEGAGTGATPSVFPGEEEAEKFLEQYGKAWDARRRRERTELVRETMGELGRGSIGFLEIIKGGTTLGAAKEGWVDASMEDSVGRLLKTIEAHYREGMAAGDRIPPAGLMELCDKFLNDDVGHGGRETKRGERFRAEVAAYRAHAEPSFSARNSFYQTVANYMVERFGTSADNGASRAALVKELGTLVGAGDRTQFLYVITDPAGRTTKVGIANDLEKRLRELEKENGTMVPVACYAIKSIPVAQWGTGVMDFLTESCANCGLAGGVGDEESRKIARERWTELGRTFGFPGGKQAPKAPKHMLEFFCSGIDNMLREQGHDLAEFHAGGAGGEEKVAEARRMMTGFLRGLLQNRSETREGCRYPDKFIESVTNLWVRTRGCISFGDAATQRECITNINNALASLFQTRADAEGETSLRVKTVLDAAAELIPPPEGDEHVSTNLLEKISRHGEHLGARAFEWDIHQFLQPLRMGKSEMFYVGTNYPAFLDAIEERMGSGVAGRRFALGRADEDGARLGRIKESLSLSVKPTVCLGTENLEKFRIAKAGAEDWAKTRKHEVPADKAGRDEFRDRLRAQLAAELSRAHGGENGIAGAAFEGVLGGLDKTGACSSPCPLGDEAKRRQWIGGLEGCGGDDGAIFTTNKGRHSVSRGDLLRAARTIDRHASEKSEIGKLLHSLAEARNETPAEKRAGVPARTRGVARAKPGRSGSTREGM